MAEKEVNENADDKLIERLLHRAELLTTVDKDVNKSYVEQEKTLLSQQNLFIEELKLIREDIEDLQKITQELRRTIFTIGHQLKDKVTKRSFEIMQEKIESWPLEGYITKKELPEIFEKHTQQK